MFAKLAAWIAGIVRKELEAIDHRAALVPGLDST